MKFRKQDWVCLRPDPGEDLLFLKKAYDINSENVTSFFTAMDIVTYYYMSQSEYCDAQGQRCQTWDKCNPNNFPITFWCSQ